MMGWCQHIVNQLTMHSEHLSLTIGVRVCQGQQGALGTDQSY